MVGTGRRWAWNDILSIQCDRVMARIGPQRLSCTVDARDDGGNSFNGRMTYNSEGLIGYRATALPS